jgi:hypothetical protein
MPETAVIPAQHQPRLAHNPITAIDCEVYTGLTELAALVDCEGDLCQHHNARAFLEIPVATLHELQARAGHLGITPQLCPLGVEWVAERRLNDRVSLRLTCLA